MSAALARQMADGFDSQFSLKPIAARAGPGYIFISLADAPPDFAPSAGDRAIFAGHMLSEANLAYEHTILERQLEARCRTPLVLSLLRQPP